LMGHTGNEIVSLSVDKLTPGVFNVESGMFRIEGEGSQVLSVGHPGGTNALFVEGSAEITRNLDVKGSIDFQDGSDGVHFSSYDLRNDVYLNEDGFKVIQDPGRYVEIGPGYIEFDGEFSHTCNGAPCPVCMIPQAGIEGPMRLGVC